MKLYKVKYLYFIFLWKAIKAAFKIANKMRLIVKKQTICTGDIVKLNYTLEVSFPKTSDYKLDIEPFKFNIKGR